MTLKRSIVQKVTRYAVGKLVHPGCFIAMALCWPFILTYGADDIHQSPASLGKGADIMKMCGNKPAIVGVADGFGGTTWRRIVLGELRDEAAKCKTITKVIYVNANGDSTKANSDINSLVAQGANIVLVYADFGASELPALRAAFRSGRVVVPYVAHLNGTAGRDYTANVYLDMYAIGERWANWFGENLKKGNVVVLGGVPGGQSSQSAMDGFKSGLAKYPGLKLLDGNYIVTNFSPTDAQRAVAGLIAKYGHIDGVATDYGVTALAAVKAFQQAGETVPAIATLASNNELNCKFVQDKKSGKAWDYYSLDSTPIISRFALRRALAEYEGTPNAEPLQAVPVAFADTAKGLQPPCSTTAPPDADFSSLLTPNQLNSIFRQ